VHAGTSPRAATGNDAHGTLRDSCGWRHLLNPSEEGVSREDLHWTTTGAAIAETRFRGRHIGEFLGVPETGRDIDVPIAIFVSFRDGLTGGERFYWDRATLLGQLKS
jgi:SnoaL-like polyketide cyclase